MTANKLEKEATLLLKRAGFRWDGRKPGDVPRNQPRLAFCGAPLTRSTRKRPRTIKVSP